MTTAIARMRRKIQRKIQRKRRVVRKRKMRWSGRRL
jgi:hypothetical protein